MLVGSSGDPVHCPPQSLCSIRWIAVSAKTSKTSAGQKCLESMPEKPQPETLQIQYSAYGLLQAVVMLYSSVHGWRIHADCAQSPCLSYAWKWFLEIPAASVSKGCRWGWPTTSFLRPPVCLSQMYKQDLLFSILQEPVLITITFHRQFSAIESWNYFCWKAWMHPRRSHELVYLPFFPNVL